ncbi:hypothetical protein ACH5RR_041039 [Cinchona calisaya]|uniref:Uncharacterized protein n=1 Tax=Cinchona calisaya TaxID=153742 RepID=A0ABD2XVF7_9GENT
MLEQSSSPEVVAELAAKFRSEQDYLDECNKNWLLAIAERFAHATIHRRSDQGIPPPYRMNKERLIDDRAPLIPHFPSHLKGEVTDASLRAKESFLKATTYPYLFIVECKIDLGIAGLEPATIRLKAQCSTN